MRSAFRRAAIMHGGRVRIFIFYRYLERGVALQEVAKILEMSSREASEVLRQLERLEMIDRMPGDKVKVRFKGHLNLKPGGKLRRRLEESWVPSFVKDIVMNRSENNSRYLRIMSTGLTPTSKDELLDEIENLAQRTAKQGHIDRSISPVSTDSVSLVICVGSRRAGEFHDLSSVSK